MSGFFKFPLYACKNLDSNTNKNRSPYLTNEVRVLWVDGEPAEMGVAVLRTVHLRVQHVLQVIRLHLLGG